MKHIGLCAFTYVCFVLHVGAADELSVNGAAPEFLLLALSVAAVGLRDNGAVVWAAVIGLLIDCVAAGPLGVSMFLAIFAVFALRKLLSKRVANFPPASVGVCALLTFAVVLLSIAGRALIGGETPDWPRWLHVAVGGAVYTAIVFAALRIVYAIAARLLLRTIGAEALAQGPATGRYA